MPEQKEIFVLLSDGDMTTFSQPTPFGVAVTSEDEAKRFVEEEGFSRSKRYEKLVLFESKDDAIDWWCKKHLNAYK